MKKWDVFISHASADKAEIAIPLAKLLTAAGLKAWIDRHEIRLGDSLREKIDEGLAESSYGVVILSPAFFGRRWTRQELNGLVAVEEDGTTRILPVWHKITKEQLAAYSPILADRMSVDTSQGLHAVASAVIDVVLSPENADSRTTPSLTRRLLDLIEGRAGPSEIIAFCCFHIEMIAVAVRHLGHASVACDVRLGQTVIPFVTSLYMPNSNQHVLVLTEFAASSGPLLNASGGAAGDIEMAIDRLIVAVREAHLTRNGSSSRWDGKDGVKEFILHLFARRRSTLSPAEKTYIGGPSATHPGLEQLRAELKMAGCHLDFRIKTYDTLAEQAALVDGTYSDRKTASYENSMTLYENPITGL